MELPQRPSIPTWDERLKVSFLVFGVAFLLRLLHLAMLRSAPFFDFKIGDALRYDQWAQTISSGHWLGEGVFYQAPLYPYFLAVVYQGLGDDLMTVRKVQAVMGALACVWLTHAAWNLFSKRSGIIAGMLLACYAPAIFYESLIQKSVLDLFLFSLSMMCLSYMIRDGVDWKWATLFGVSLGAFCLTRENALLLIPPALLWVAMDSWRRSERPRAMSAPLKMGLCFTIGLSLLLLPVALRNWAIGGEFHLTTSQLGPNLFIGNNPEANGTYRPLKVGRGDARFEQADAVALAEEAVGRKLSAGEVSEYYVDQVIAYVKSDPQDWLDLMKQKAWMTFNAAEFMDTEDLFVHAQWSPPLRFLSGLFHFGLVLPLGMAGIWFSRSRWRELWLMYGFVALLLATVIAFFVLGRYRLPVIPVLIPFAAFALTETWGAFRRSSLPRRVVCGTAFAICLYVCNRPLGSEMIARSVTYNNFAAEHLIRGQMSEAETFLGRSLAIQPGNALARNNLGVLYREKGRMEAARKQFQMALEIEPTFENAARNLQRLSP